MPTLLIKGAVQVTGIILMCHGVLDTNLWLVGGGSFLYVIGLGLYISE
jgi:hypothetical protein